MKIDFMSEVATDEAMAKAAELRDSYDGKSATHFRFWNGIVQELKAHKMKLEGKSYIVRLYDMFDGWIDISGPLSKEEADRLWNDRTKNGTVNTKYADGDYYKVFPANTKMVHTPEFRGR